MLLTQIYDDPTDKNEKNEKLNEKYLKKIYEMFPSPPKKNVSIPSFCNNRIDILWTYVNGTEEHWIENFNRWSQEKYDDKRFRDYESLKYSMRSVYENIPFDIHWHLLIQDEFQIPTFLNKSKLIYYNDTSKPETLRIIFHRDIFPNNSYLPIFNSNAIESMFHNIKGINECFIYMNDDFFYKFKNYN